MFLTETIAGRQPDPIIFPKLGITVDPNPVAFTVFGKEIYWYGIIIAMGFLLAVLYMMYRAKDFGLTQDDVLDMVLWAVPIGVICARAYYCIFYWEQYADDPISVFYIWKGGLAIYGGIVGGAVTLLVVSRIKKIRTSVMLDVAGTGVIIGQFCGRWGNFMNREAFGGYTDGPFAMRLLESHLPQQTRLTEAGAKLLQMAQEGGYAGYIQVHPTFLYESVWNLIGFIGLHFYVKRRKFDGEMFLLYMAWYGLGRVWIEGLRTDSLYLFSTGIRVSQLLAFVFFAVGVGMIAFIRIRRKPTPEGLYVRQKAGTQAETEPEDEQKSDNL